MATIESSNHSLSGIRVRHASPVERAPHAALSSPSLAQVLGQLGQLLLGAMLLLLGAAMVLTLWLLPIGLPLTLLGVALLAAENRS